MPVRIRIAIPLAAPLAPRLLCAALLALVLGGIPAAPLPQAVAAPRRALAAGGPRYDIGSPILTDLWVDPANGDDAHSGASRAQALRTITAAWQRIPAGAPLTGTGYRILLAAGDYPESTFPLYWEDRHGTAQFPILLQAADGPRTAHLQAFVNVFNVDYLYFVGVELTNHGDVFHCEQCRYVLIRNSRLDGGDREAHETIKVNQSQHLYIEDSDVSGTYENAIDFVAVQYANIVGNRLFNAGDWCAYVKGGSAYITVESNEFYDCDTGGFTAGQGAGFEYMTEPWLHYEAYAIRVVNNVIHDTNGAGLGVNGGYDVLLAYNTLYRVGQRSHVIEVVHGSRSCDGDTLRCAAHNALGGWGPAGLANAQPIPDRNIYIYNNVILNPAGYQSQWQQFAIGRPQAPDAGSNVPTPARTDDNLRIQGNIIWNGPATLPLGIEDGEVCTAGNPTCNETQLRRDNAINTVAPELVNPAGGDYRLANAAALPAPLALPPFPAWDSFTPAVPAAALANAVLTDYTGATRSGHDQPGAFAAGSPAPPTATPTPPPAPTATATPPAPDMPFHTFLPALQSAVTRPAIDHPTH